MISKKAVYLALFIIIQLIINAEINAQTVNENQNKPETIKQTTEKTKESFIHEDFGFKEVMDIEKLEFHFFFFKTGVGATNFFHVADDISDNKVFRGDISINSGFRFAYMKRGAGFIADIEWHRVTVIDEDEQIKLDYLSINLMGTYNFDKLYFLGGGIYASYLVKAKIQDSGKYDSFNKPDFGIILIFGGINTFFSKTFKAFVCVETKIGLVNISHDFFKTSGYGKISVFSIMITIGFGV
jgi:hypothetical protein